MGAQWLSSRVPVSRPKGRGFEPHRRHCIVSLSKNINPSLVLVQPRKTRPFITERLFMGRKESNQTNKKPNKQGGRRRSDRSGPLFWTSMLSAVSLFLSFGSFIFLLTSDFILMQSSILTLVARVIHRPT